ncbi:MAG TPA: PilN domain-containing protein [Candidatus Acidoferrales bacterium]|jgi:Tfp pilus assembly protein PilN|nr:PilN domain-containing protein [Candidatus Acidoferrales bacterium]
MIRINLLGQIRPKATKQSVPLESTLQILLGVAALAIALIVLSVTYYSQKRQLDDTNARIAALKAERTNLQQIKQEVDRFETQKAALQTQIGVIEGLQKNRTGAQELLQMVANTVVRVDQLWLTSLDRTGDNLHLTGEAGSVDSIANFMTQMRRSGYFDKIEIDEAKEDDVAKSVTTYGFTMSAAVAQAAPAPGQPQPKPAAGTSTTTPPQPAAKGRS